MFRFSRTCPPAEFVPFGYRRHSYAVGANDRVELSGAGAQPPQPEGAQTPEEFVAALRRLRLWSGLTYRQLEAKANANGDVLPVSTLASALGRSTLPREQLVEGLVRACGLTADDVDRWLAARKRIAMCGDVRPTATAPAAAESRPQPSVPAGPPEPPAKSGPAMLVRLVLVGMALVGIGIGAYVLAPISTNEASNPTPPGVTTPAPGLPLGGAGSWARIRPGQSAELCVSEGRDRSGGYQHAVAALRPCASATVPSTYLEPVGAGLMHIQWHHPEHGIGCLTVRDDGVGKDLIEPWNDCSDSRSQQLFTAEPVTRQRDGAPRFRLRIAYTGQCVGLRDETATPGVEVVRENCTGQADQEFLIDLLPSVSPQ